jgi:hypothetical protein
MMRDLAVLIGLMIVLLIVPPSSAAPKAEPWSRWEAHNAAGEIRVDHGPWNLFLSNYLDSAHPSGITRVRYGAVGEKDLRSLEEYVSSLEKIPVSQLRREEQKAYWINLYNAVTVRTILRHYPVESIRAIKISPGLFASGPWGKKLVTVEGEEISLNDIEHRILRPLWRDNRVHYAVNCASLGCPNLLPEAFTADNTERLLESAARTYVNHPRGAELREGRLHVSSIYEWFKEDFGGGRQGVIDHLRKYAEEPLASGLKSFTGKVKAGYDWSLNE